MATSSRNTFTASSDGAKKETSLISNRNVSTPESRARAKLIELQAERIEFQLSETTQENKPVLADTNGKVKPLGGEAITPRAFQGTGSTPKGAPVQYNQRIATGQQLNAFNQIIQRQFRGWLSGDGPPEIVKPIPRYAGDRYLDELTLTLYYWQQVSEDVAEWVTVFSGAEVLVLDTPPTLPPDKDKAIAFVRNPKEIYVWDTLAITPAWLGPYGNGGDTTASRLVLVSSSMNLTIPNSTLSGTTLDFAANGFTELVDTQGYYDASNPTQISFAESGVYRCTFKATFDNLNTTNTFTNWFVTLRLTGSEFDSVSWTYSRGDLNVIDNNDIKELVFYLQPTAGQQATLEILQVNNEESTRFVFPQNKSFFTVEKIA